MIPKFLDEEDNIKFIIKGLEDYSRSYTKVKISVFLFIVCLEREFLKSQVFVSTFI